MNKNEKQMIYYPCVHVVGDLLYTLINETNRESELMNGISLFSTIFVLSDSRISKAA